MKKYILIILAVSIWWSCGNKTHFNVTGEIVPTVDGTIILSGLEAGKPVPIDSVELVNGKFKFTGDVEVPEPYLLRIKGEEKNIAQLFLEAGNIDITIYPDSFESNVITGSKSNDLFDVYMDEMIKFTTSDNELRQRFGIAQASGNTEEIEAVKFEYETIVQNRKIYSKNFISEYSESPVAAFVYLSNFSQQADLNELDSILKVFEPIRTSYFVAVIQERANSLRTDVAAPENAPGNAAIGATAPDFTLKDTDGNPIALSSLKGKYVLIDFWASWCKPCMMELPNVIVQYKTFKNKGFEIIGVSLDREKDAWVSTINAEKMNWVNVWDMEENNPGAVANLYGVTGIPHTVLLDKEGKIIAKNLRGPALKTKLTELLN